MVETSLGALPIDVLTIISNWLSCGDIYRLWKTGSFVMRAKLRSGVCFLAVSLPKISELLYWPRIVSYFPNLRHIEVVLPLNLGIESWSLEAIEGSAMETIIWQGDASALLAHMVNDRTIKPLRAIFPLLRVLKVRGGQVMALTEAMMSQLPPTLLVFDWTAATMPSGSFLAAMFPKLLELSFEDMETTKNLTWPPSLTKLGGLIPAQLSIVLPTKDRGQLEQPPATNIKEICILSSTERRESERLGSLLPALEYVWYPSYSVDLIALPKTLTKLVMRIVDFDKLSLLPPGLLYLVAHPRFHSNGSASQNPIRFLLQSLPRGLRELELCSSDFALDSFWKDEELALLPKTLRHLDLHILCSYVFQPHQTFQDLLPNLTSLRMCKRFQVASKLPPGMRSFGKPTHTVFSPNENLHLSRSLLHLQHLDEVQINIMAFAVISTQQSLLYIDSNVYNTQEEPIEPSTYFISDFKDSKGHIATSVLKKMEKIKCRLDLGLSRSVSKLELHCGTDKDCHAQLEILFSKPSLNSSSLYGHHEHFYQLSDITISVPQSTWATFGGLPSSCRNLTLYGNLEAILNSLPKKLEKLVASVHEVSDLCLQSLPEDLTELDLKMSSFADYNPEALAALPKSLLILRIPASRSDILQRTPLLAQESAAQRLLPPNLLEFTLQPAAATTWTAYVKSRMQQRHVNK
jgi:hypothetical protein